MAAYKRIERKHRVSTKDRFVSVLKGGSLETDQPTPWYKMRGNFITLIVIVFCVAIAFIIQIFLNVTDRGNPLIPTKPEDKITQPLPSPTPDDGELTYEEAKRIFTGK